MKVLHSSDWHLGHILYGYDRNEEQKAVLRQLAEIVRQEKPDVFLVSGDVFHTSSPSAAINRLFVEALNDIAEAHPGISIVVTAGNHDSASKHEVFRTPWKKVGIHLIGSLHTDNPEDHIIEIPGKGLIVAVPYVNERNMPEGFVQQLLDRTEEMNKAGLPVILMGHTTVSGCDFKGHDDIVNYSVGGIETKTVDEMGTGYDYLALGHIHRKQWIDNGDKHIRYSGSILPTSFDDDSHHSVSIIEIAKHGSKPDFKEIELKNPWPLVNLPQEGTTDWDTALLLLKEFPDSKQAYIRINITIDGSLPPGAHNEALKLTEGKRCRLCHINTVRSDETGSRREDSLTLEEFTRAEPLDIARRYFNTKGVELDSEMENMFREIIESLNLESNQ